MPTAPQLPTRGPWPVLSSDALYGLAGDVVRAIEPHTESDPAAILMSYLVAFGSAVGPLPHAVADAAEHPARLFAVICGESARARKGTSWKNVKVIFEKADPDWVENSLSGGVASGEGLLAPIADPGVEKRLLALEEEFGKVLIVGSRGNNTLSTMIRQLWDNGDVRIMTKKKPTRVTGGHVSMLAHITIEELDAKLGYMHRCSGFGNRYMYVCARRTRRLPLGTTLDPGIVGTLGFRTLNALEDARQLRRLHRTPAADTLWVRLYNEMADDLPGGTIEALVARSEAHVLRLSVAYALIDGSPLIDVPHLKAAWALWSYCRQSVDAVFGVADPVVDVLFQRLQTAGPAGLTLLEQYDSFSGNVTRHRLASARTHLEELGLIETHEVPSSGRRPRRVSRIV